MAEYSKHNFRAPSTPGKSKTRSVYAKAVKEKFETLGCPFTESADETWILELIFKPGEPRIRILQWLFSKFHRKLFDILDPVYTSSKSDTRLKAILYVASNIGLCRKNDIDLIEGHVSATKQMSFMNRLLDMVLIIDAAEDPSKRAFTSHYNISEGTKLQEQYARDCQLIDSIPLQQPIEDLFPPTVSVLPVDLKKQLEKAKLRQSADERCSSPDMQLLAQKATIAAEDLARQTDILRQLQKEHQYVNVDPGIRENLTRKFRLVLSELHQMIVSFIYCYENNIQQWCNRSSPEISALGDKTRTVHRLLENFNVVMNSLEIIRKSHTRIDNVDSDAVVVKDISQAQQEIDALAQSLAVLEQTLNSTVKLQ